MKEERTPITRLPSASTPPATSPSGSNPPASPPSAHCAHRPDPPVRAQAIAAASTSWDASDEAATVAIAPLPDLDPQIRLATVGALRFLHAKSADPLTHALQAEPDDTVREHLRETLRILHFPDPDKESKNNLDWQPDPIYSRTQMPARILSGILLLSATLCLCQRPPSDPTLSGYITRFVSLNDFDVNGKHILLGPRAEIQSAQNTPNGLAYETRPTADLKPYLGEPVDIFGELTSKTQTIATNRAIFYLPAPRQVIGMAIVDAILPVPVGADPTTDHLVRADGYPILLTSKTKVTFNKPLPSTQEIRVNLWISYRGTQREDGVVLADKVDFSKNIIDQGEDKLREKEEYDPGAVPSNKKQGTLSKQIRGIDPKQIPPYNDAAMQARVSEIGAKLVPKYQVDFPYTEETRIDFRFQVIDSTKWRDALTLPNGIILVPHQVVERMQNDSQLATVLADNIACALEKQPLYYHEQAVDLAATNIAGSAVGFVIPGVGLLTDIATGTAAARQKRLYEEQSGRVSLSLLHDAGYDIQQAPVAWWLLAPKKPEDIQKIPLPRRAGYLYQFLGETWPFGAFAAAPTATPPASPGGR